MDPDIDESSSAVSEGVTTTEPEPDADPQADKDTSQVVGTEKGDIPEPEEEMTDYRANFEDIYIQQYRYWIKPEWVEGMFPKR